MSQTYVQSFSPKNILPKHQELWAALNFCIMKSLLEMGSYFAGLSGPVQSYSKRFISSDEVYLEAHKG